ncbi:hypothetical protein VTI74DRAFT_3477 [Chaetomium olivicolor]
MTFDFQPFLKTLYPSTTYSTTLLSGGLVNFTVRACRTNPPPAAQDSPHPPASLILKHAPPYIASVGAAAPFSQSRQAVEATLLRFFNNASSVTHAVRHGDRGGIRIPRVLAHDAEHQVLALEDLGPLVTLWELLDPTQPHPASTITPAGALLARCSAIGSSLGAFFATLHSPCTLTGLRSLLGGEAEVLEQSLAADVVFDVAVGPVLGRLQKQGRMDEASARKLYARVEQDYRREAYPGEGCLSMGDFHPGSVLVTALGLAEREEDAMVGVIDWEFATIRDGRGVNGDMAQFLASLHVLIMSLPRDGEKGLLREAVVVLVKEMCRAYAEGSGLVRRVAEVVRDSREAGKVPVMGIFRSAMILFGRETVNQAIDRKWDHGPGTTVAEMVQAGAWYLERAGDSVEEMLEESNWEEMMAREDNIILWLFGLAQQRMSECFLNP